MQKNSISRSLRKLHRAYNRLNLTHIVAFVLLACVHKAVFVLAVGYLADYVGVIHSFNSLTG